MAKSSKPAADAAPKAKAAPKPPKPKATPPAPVAESPVAPAADPAAATLRIKDLLDRVVARSGAKRPVAKPVVEAVLAELGEALSRGESFALPPLGRARVNRSKAAAGGEVITIKLKRGAAKKAGDTPLASEED